MSDGLNPDDKKEAPKPLVEPGGVVKPGQTNAGKWVDNSHWGGGDNGEWVKSGMWVPDENMNYGKAPGAGWTPALDPNNGTFIGWQNTNQRSGNGWAVMPYDKNGTLQPASMPVESKGQYGYGSERHQKFNRLFTYLTKGILGAMFLYGGGAAAGLWGGAAGGVAEGAGGALGSGSVGPVLGSAEGALGGPAAGEGLTALGSGQVAEAATTEGALGGPAAGEGSAQPAWMKYARQATDAMQSIPQGGGQPYVYQQPQSDVQQYDSTDADALRAKADELRARIAALKGSING